MALAYHGISVCRLSPHAPPQAYARLDAASRQIAQDAKKASDVGFGHVCRSNDGKDIFVPPLQRAGDAASAARAVASPRRLRGR